MVNENFGFAGRDDDQTDPTNGQDWRQPDDRNTVDTEALERWLVKNRNLWFLGLRLAAAARQYKREYINVPFNKNGWFSPN